MSSESKLIKHHSVFTSALSTAPLIWVLLYASLLCLNFCTSKVLQATYSKNSFIEEILKAWRKTWETKIRGRGESSCGSWAPIDSELPRSYSKKNKKKTYIVLGHQMNTTQLKLPNTGQLGSVHWFETLPGCLICTQIKGKCDK